jgi:serine O-acetyltransferase
MIFFKDLWDLVAAFRKYDPATKSSIEILLLYPGIKAWVIHQLSHFFYQSGVPFVPRLLSEAGRLITGIDIHPGANLGKRVLIDHGMGVVIGETAVVEDDVLIYQGVTLGGTTLERQKKRHPTIKEKCVLGAGCKILGDITVGVGCRIGAGSVVVRDVPPGSTVVGIPGRVVASAGVKEGQELEHGLLPDPFMARINEIESRLKKLEGLEKSSS